MKVRATQDGTYGGYYRYGPVFGDAGDTPGEVFEIDAKPFIIKDEWGKSIPALDDNGKPKKDKSGNPVFVTGTWFSPEWMERVSEDTPVTYDYPPFELPIPYRAKKEKAQNLTKPIPITEPLETSVI